MYLVYSDGRTLLSQLQKRPFFFFFAHMSWIACGTVLFCFYANRQQRWLCLHGQVFDAVENNQVAVTEYKMPPKVYCINLSIYKLVF